MLGNNVSGTPEIAISVRTKVLIIVRIFSTFSIYHQYVRDSIMVCTEESNFSAHLYTTIILLYYH